MDFSVIAAFTAAGMAGATSIMSLIVSHSNAKKNSIIRVIVETRIKYLQQLRDANAKFIGVANPEVIYSVQKINTALFVYPKELAESVGLLITLLKPFYQYEKRLVELINVIERNCLTMFMGEADDVIAEKIKKDLAIYMKLFAQYDWAYWQYIMKQADGKCINSNVDFDNVYKETQKEISKRYDYEWI